MKIQNNKGFEPEVIDSYKKKMDQSGLPYIIDEDDDNTDDYVHFYFIGKYEGRDVIYDCAIYTLRLHHNSELYEIAEHKAAQTFPEFKSIKYVEDENGDLKQLDDLEEEIGLFMAEVIMQMEEDGEVKVREHVEVDPNLDFGIGLDVGLNVEKVDSDTIRNFIHDFNEDVLKLDETMYSFQNQGEEIA